MHGVLSRKLTIGQFAVLKRKPKNFLWDTTQTVNEAFNISFVRWYLTRWCNQDEWIWEPFAGHKTSCRTLSLAKNLGYKIVAFDIANWDTRVYKKDSTKEGPGRGCQGVIFHPPYFGTSLQSQEVGDISSIEDEEEYEKALRKTVRLAVDAIGENGTACVIGRQYHFRGKLRRMAFLYTSLFYEEGFELVEVLSCVPDVAVILKRGK